MNTRRQSKPKQPLRKIRRWLILLIIGMAAIYGVLQILDMGKRFDIDRFVKDSGFEMSETPRQIDFSKLEAEHGIEITGDIVVVNFWATWCAPCVAELADFSKISRKFSPKNLQILAVGTGESSIEINKFLSDKKIDRAKMIFIPDEKKQISQQYDIRVLPVTLLADKNGKIITGVLGIRPWLNDDYQDFLKYLIKYKQLN